MQTTAADADAAMAENITRLFAGANGAEGQVNQTAQAAADANAAVGALDTEVTAKIGPSGTITSAVSEHTTAIATLDGYAAASWGLVIDVNGAIVGAIHLDGDAQSSAFTVNANNFLVTFPGSTGGDPVPVFTISNVDGVAKIVWRGDMIGDGMITARSITVYTRARLRRHDVSG